MHALSFSKLVYALRQHSNTLHFIKESDYKYRLNEQRHISHDTSLKLFRIYLKSEGIQNICHFLYFLLLHKKEGEKLLLMDMQQRYNICILNKSLQIIRGGGIYKWQNSMTIFFFLKLFSRSTFMFAYRSGSKGGGGQEPIHEGGQR